MASGREARPRRPADLEAERRRTRDWLTAFDDVLEREGPERAERLLRQLQRRASRSGVHVPRAPETPYVNTIAPREQRPFPGDLEMERRIEGLVRWNAMAMVVRANRRLSGIGGHLGSFASAATLFEVGFNHFFRGADHPEGGDQVFLQGHSSPGVYARAFLEGRLEERQLENFRRELQPGGGLSSYPHPWLMPEFWEFPSVSMGLAPVMAIYQARFNAYLEKRGLVESTGRTWAVVGDGEMDEPESVGALTRAAREGLGRLTLVVDCNLQRLDGPVRGSGKVIQELESLFRGAGWNVIKVLWSTQWDELLERDVDGLLVEALDETLDGEFQKYAVEGGAYMRERLFGGHEELLSLVEHLSDEEIAGLGRGGHDIRKVHAAYAAAERETQRPTVVLAQTVKGHGLGEAGEALNVAHKTKDLDEKQLRAFRDRLGIPIPDAELGDVPFQRPDADSAEMEYLRERREALGGSLPRRQVRAAPLEGPSKKVFEPYLEGSGDREATTTMILVRLLSDLLKDEQVGRLVVPIVPDEARTFGLEALFPQVQIYAPRGQRYVPVDADQLLSYDEAEDGQILEEGITEAGAISSAIAAGTAHVTHGINAIPFYFFYSMFGFQRTGDLAWAAGDQRARGFLIGATSGRTTLNGEGLQHQDGHSHLIAMGHPNVRAWDPAFGYELAVIIEEGIRRGWGQGEDVLHYVTVSNQPFVHPQMPQGIREDLLKGMYRYSESSKSGEVRRVRLLASGILVQEALEAQRILEEDWGVTAEVWSVTSWKGLHDDALAAERRARLHPEEDEPALAHVTRCLGGDDSPVVAVSDFVKSVPGTLARWIPAPFVPLGTEGFGRSDSREALRDFFEVDRRHVALAALDALAREDRLPRKRVAEAIEAFEIRPDKPDPAVS